MTNYNGVTDGPSAATTRSSAPLTWAGMPSSTSATATTTATCGTPGTTNYTWHLLAMPFG
jgi:hypothetical protein